MALSSEQISQLMSMNKSQPQYQSQSQNQQIDKLKLMAAISRIDGKTLNNLIDKARQEGISDTEIQNGLSLLLNNKF